jgi:hypothetical protein
MDNNMAVAKSGQVETYVDTRASIPSLPKKAESNKEKEKFKWEPDQPDPVDAVINVGDPCTHNGCKATYKGEESRKEVCVYHPGPAEFHEGSKGWVCCKPRALEFTEFLKIPGCMEGPHRFVPDKSQIKVKYDYYQSASFVNMTFYSKNVKKADSKFTFEPNTLHVTLTLSNGDVYKEDIYLAKAIIPEQCKFEILSTKVEVKLKKALAEEWNHFNLSDDSIIIL